MPITANDVENQVDSVRQRHVDAAEEAPERLREAVALRPQLRAVRRDRAPPDHVRGRCSARSDRRKAAALRRYHQPAMTIVSPPEISPPISSGRQLRKRSVSDQQRQRHQRDQEADAQLRQQARARDDADQHVHPIARRALAP